MQPMCCCSLLATCALVMVEPGDMGTSQAGLPSSLATIARTAQDRGFILSCLSWWGGVGCGDRGRAGECSLAAAAAAAGGWALVGSPGDAGQGRAAQRRNPWPRLLLLPCSPCPHQYTLQHKNRRGGTGLSACPTSQQTCNPDCQLPRPSKAAPHPPPASAPDEPVGNRAAHNGEACGCPVKGRVWW